MAADHSNHRLFGCEPTRDVVVVGRNLIGYFLVETVFSIYIRELMGQGEMREIEGYDCGLNSIVAILSYRQMMNILNTKKKLLSLEQRRYKFQLTNFKWLCKCRRNLARVIGNSFRILTINFCQKEMFIL